MTALIFLRALDRWPALDATALEIRPLGRQADELVHADAGWPELPYLDEGTVRSQLAAARDSRLYVAHGLNHYDVLARPSQGLIHALRAFAHDIRRAHIPHLGPVQA